MAKVEVEWRQVEPFSKGSQVAHRLFVDGEPGALMELVLGLSGIKVLVDQNCHKEYSGISLAAGRSKYEMAKRAKSEEMIREIREKQKAGLRMQKAQQQAEKQQRKENRRLECEQRQAQRAVEAAVTKTRTRRMRQVAVANQPSSTDK